MFDVTQVFPVHPHRGRILSELHARPFAPVQAPARVLRLGFITQADRVAAATGALAARCAQSGLRPPDADARHAKIDFPEGCFQFERHNEFITYTWILRGTDLPFSPGPTTFPMIDWLPAPGLLIIASDVHVVLAASVPDVLSAFSGVSTAASVVDGGRAVVATDFAADSQGFVRFLVADRASDALSAAALVQTVLEIDTYRSLTLLGLPEALNQSAAVERFEKMLPDILDGVGRSTGADTNRLLLNGITALSADVETLAASSSFRFGATRAYAQLLEQRLDTLREQPVEHAGTWRSFLNRRLSPAVRTCAAVESRFDVLSTKIERTTALLRTRVDVDLETQNSKQLEQMADRLRLQVRLQQAVEGLSVAAISYYAAGLVHYIAEPLQHAGWRVDPPIASALSIPVVALGVWLTLRRIRSAHA